MVDWELRKERWINNVRLLLKNLKNNENLPYTIKRRKCIERKKRCRKHHNEAVITKYNKKTNKFTIKFYGMHRRGVVFESDQPEEHVIKYFLDGYKRRIIKVSDIRDYIKKSNPVLDEILSVRMTKSERNEIKRKSGKTGLTISEYARLILLTKNHHSESNSQL